MTVNEVAALTKFSAAAIRKFVLRREIPFRKVRKAIRFRPSEIEAWINAGGMVDEAVPEDVSGQAELTFEGADA